MAFGLLYLAMALIGKTSSDIKYGIDRVSAREQAREKGRDTYIDGRGIMRTVDGNIAVSMYRNDRGETLLLNKNGDTVKIYNKKNEESYGIVTAKQCFDNRGNCQYLDIPGKHKNCKVQGYRYVDIKTGKYITVRAMELDDSLESKVNKHYFYVDPYTLEIIRESDGEAELRRRGNKFSPSIEKVNEFIKAYNQKQKERYEPFDYGWTIEDRGMESINKTMWNQGERRERS